MRFEGRHVLLALALVLVAGAISVGVYIMGSPAAARIQRLDERRVADLQAISSAVDVYWSRHKRLPDSLSATAQEAGLFEQTNDPVTGAPYEYSASEPEHYRLCAVFVGRSTGGAGFWSHGPGRQCFDIVVNRVHR